MPKFASIVSRIAGKGASAWDTHFKSMKAREAGEDVIILSVGDPDCTTPEPIIEAAVSALRQGDTHYTEILGRENLRMAVLGEIRPPEGLARTSYCPANVMITSGTQNAIFAASLLIAEAGDEVIALTPTYMTYEATLQLAGATLVRVDTPRETSFRLDADALEKAITEKTQAIAIATPNNPTGVVMHEDELRKIAELAIANDLWVIADEVYSAQTYETPHISIACLPGMAERTITCGSLSKSQAMTGWRLGWMIAPEKLIAHAANLGLAMLYGVPGFIQEAATVALTSERQSISEMLGIYRKRRDLIALQLTGLPGIELLKPEAGMFFLVDVSATGLDAGRFARALYESEKVSVLDGAAFGKPAANCIRLSFTAGEAELEEGCRRIQRFVKALGASEQEKERHAS